MSMTSIEYDKLVAAGYIDPAWQLSEHRRSDLKMIFASLRIDINDLDVGNPNNLAAVIVRDWELQNGSLQTYLRDWYIGGVAVYVEDVVQGFPERQAYSGFGNVPAPWIYFTDGDNFIYEYDGNNTNKIGQADGAIHAMDTDSESNLYITGGFTTITYADGSSASGFNNVAMYDRYTDEWLSLGLGVNGTGYAIIFYASNDIVIGGNIVVDFNEEVPAVLNIGRWNGTIWTGLNGATGPSLSGQVNVLLNTGGGRLYIAGYFTENLVWWAGDTPTVFHDANPDIVSAGPLDIKALCFDTSYTNKLFVGGNFTLNNSQNLLCIDISDDSIIAEYSLDGDVRGIARYVGDGYRNIYIAGGFSSIINVSTGLQYQNPNIASLNIAANMTDWKPVLPGIQNQYTDGGSLSLMCNGVVADGVNSIYLTGSFNGLYDTVSPFPDGPIVNDLTPFRVYGDNGIAIVNVTGIVRVNAITGEYSKLDNLDIQNIRAVKNKGYNEG